MKHDLVALPTLKIVGMYRTFTGPDEGFGKLWAELMSGRVREIQNKIEGDYYGVMVPATGGGSEHEYYAGIAVTAFGEIPRGMRAIEVPANTYARFAHVGSLMKLCDTIDWAFTRGEAAVGRKFSRDPQLEIYGPEFDPVSPKSVMHFAVPVVAG